jgi:hypothetical protein
VTVVPPRNPGAETLCVAVVQNRRWLADNDEPEKRQSKSPDTGLDASPVGRITF